MEYVSIEEAKASDGLRIVLLQGLPSPWGQAAKTMMEMKGFDYVVAPFLPGGSNEVVFEWAGENSAPVVAWNDERPLTRWNDILFLLERLAPNTPLIPEAAEDRILFFGLCHEICGELGLGWSRRLQMFGPAVTSGQASQELEQMANKYGFNQRDMDAAGIRIAGTLYALSEQ